MKLEKRTFGTPCISAAKGIGNFHDKRPQFYNASGVKVALILLIIYRVFQKFVPILYLLKFH